MRLNEKYLILITSKINEVKSKIPNVSSLVKNTDYNTKISEIENKIITDHDLDKYIIAQEFNKLKSENFNARLAKTNLVSKGDIANYVKNRFK